MRGRKSCARNQALEELATMPLDLKPGCDRPSREAEPGQQYLSDRKIDFVISRRQPVARDAALGIFK
jgi:hypothetical protein